MNHLPNVAEFRKQLPVATGVVDYFPDALIALAELSRIGNDQHNPGKPLHWDRSKSGDEADALMRHLIDRGTVDTDGVRHSTKVAWRALALLQKELEAAKNKVSVTLPISHWTPGFKELLPLPEVFDGIRWLVGTQEEFELLLKGNDLLPKLIAQYFDGAPLETYLRNSSISPDTYARINAARIVAYKLSARQIYANVLKTIC